MVKTRLKKKKEGGGYGRKGGQNGPARKSLRSETTPISQWTWRQGSLGMDPTKGFIGVQIRNVFSW